MPTSGVVPDKGLQADKSAMLRNISDFTSSDDLDTYSIATGTWYNARVSKSPCEYRNGAVTFYFAELERARDQKELPYSER